MPTVLALTRSRWRLWLGLAIVLLALLGAATWGWLTYLSNHDPVAGLTRLSQHLVSAQQALERGDVEGARAAYRAFDDGWDDVEDGVKARSRQAYGAIEDAMRDVKERLVAPPKPDVDASRQALARLQTEVSQFLNSPAAAGRSQAPRAAKGDVLGLLRRARVVKAEVGRGDAAAALAAMKAFQAAWPDSEDVVRARAPEAYLQVEEDMPRLMAVLGAATPDMGTAARLADALVSRLGPVAKGARSYGWSDAAIILLREGFEALLVIAALLAFLKRSGNDDKARWVWGGGTLGVVVSIALAGVAQLLFARAASGRNRELVEGLAGLAAAAMLVYVSYWLHSKSHVGAWQSYIRSRTSRALATNSLLALGLVAFFAVFREGAETVVFFLGIAPSIAMSELLLGILVGGLALAGIAVLILALGVRIPIRPFFLVTSLLLYYLAFKFVGTGIHSLQVAGWLPVAGAPQLPSSPQLGIFPTWQTTLVQLALLLAGAAVVLVSSRAGKRQAVKR